MQRGDLLLHVARLEQFLRRGINRRIGARALARPRRATRTSRSRQWRRPRPSARCRPAAENPAAPSGLRHQLDHELPVEALVDHAGEVGKPGDQLQHEIGVDLRLRPCRPARCRRKTGSRRRRRSARSAPAPSPAAASSNTAWWRRSAAAPAASAWRASAAATRGAGLADMGDDRLAPGDCLIANSSSARRLGIGQADGFARMHRHGKRVGAVARGETRSACRRDRSRCDVRA